MSRRDPQEKGNTMQTNEQELARALRGGLQGRFRNSFHMLEAALEVLDDQMACNLTPAQYDALRPMFAQISGQLRLLRRLGEHAADAAIAPVLHQTCTPQPIELLSQLRETEQIFNEIVAQAKIDAVACLEADEGVQAMLTMGDPALLDGLLANLFSNSLAAQQPMRITLACMPGAFLYRDNGPGLPPDAAEFLRTGVWSDRLLEQGGLGLPLIRAYAQAMGWTLAVQDTPGMALRFALPDCDMPLGSMVLESDAAAQGRQWRRQRLQEELAPLLAQTPDAL